MYCIYCIRDTVCWESRGRSSHCNELDHFANCLLQGWDHYIAVFVCTQLALHFFLGTRLHQIMPHYKITLPQTSSVAFNCIMICDCIVLLGTSLHHIRLHCLIPVLLHFIALPCVALFALWHINAKHHASLYCTDQDHCLDCTVSSLHCSAYCCS